MERGGVVCWWSFNETLEQLKKEGETVRKYDETAKIRRNGTKERMTPVDLTMALPLDVHTCWWNAGKTLMLLLLLLGSTKCKVPLQDETVKKKCFNELVKRKGVSVGAIMQRVLWACFKAAVRQVISGVDQTHAESEWVQKTAGPVLRLYCLVASSSRRKRLISPPIKDFFS